MRLKDEYGPEVKYKKGLHELLGALGRYEPVGDSTANPLAVVEGILRSGSADILEVGSGWEKEAIDAIVDYGVGINWISLNPMLADPKHNQRVIDQIDDHTLNPHIRRVLSGMGIDEPPRKAVAALSIALPFNESSFDLAIASWSVPTVLEERISGQALDHNSVEFKEAWEGLMSLVGHTCREYARVVRPSGTIITFPVREHAIIDEMIRVLDKRGKWDHAVCTVYDNTYYTRDSEDKVNYLLMSQNIE